MKKPLPALAADAAAEAFVDEADLSDFDLSTMVPTDFEFAPKAARVNMRLPTSLLDAVKAKAKSQGVPYQRFIRQALEHAIGNPKGPTVVRRSG
jgi:predicted DNA binding CopG/RHH family protein